MHVSITLHLFTCCHVTTTRFHGYDSLSVRPLERRTQLRTVLKVMQVPQFVPWKAAFKFMHLLAWHI